MRKVHLFVFLLIIISFSWSAYRRIAFQTPNAAAGEGYYNGAWHNVQMVARVYGCFRIGEYILPRRIKYLGAFYVKVQRHLRDPLAVPGDYRLGRNIKDW